jgi:hypothetical protein
MEGFWRKVKLRQTDFVKERKVGRLCARQTVMEE